MKNKIYALTAILFLTILACDLSTPVPQADPNAFNTMVAQTAQVQFIQMTQTALAALPPAGQPPAPPNPAPAPVMTPAMTDEAAIKQALLAKLGWSEAELEFSIGQNTGQIARGSLKRVSEPSGAAWFAGKDAGGKWVIAYIGQGVPTCNDIQAFNFPVDWISHCLDTAGNTVQRAGSQPAPPAPSQDVYAPDPLGPAWSGMWFANGACYDLDVLFTASDASCDVTLDATAQTILIPKNQAIFAFQAFQTPPSLGQCKAAAMSANPSGPLMTNAYFCFKTNAGKYGFFVARKIQADGIEFDAYVFP